MIPSKISRLPFNVPWFMFDISNGQLITSKIIPGDIHDTKEIVLAETPIPGLNYRPVTPGGGGNRKLDFTIPLIKRNNSVGNVLLLQQFAMLRNQAQGFLNFNKLKFNPMPKVLYFWGTGSVPLPYWVAKCDCTHKAGWVNQIGQPQYSEIEISLVLDEEDPLYQTEEMYRTLSALLGEAQQAVDVSDSAANQSRPY